MALKSIESKLGIRKLAESKSLKFQTCTVTYELRTKVWFHSKANEMEIPKNFRPYLYYSRIMLRAKLRVKKLEKQSFLGFSTIFYKQILRTKLRAAKVADSFRAWSYCIARCCPKLPDIARSCSILVDNARYQPKLPESKTFASFSSYEQLLPTIITKNIQIGTNKSSGIYY